MQFVPWVNGKQPEVMAHHHINHDPRIHGLEGLDLCAGIPLYCAQVWTEEDDGVWRLAGTEPVQP